MNHLLFSTCLTLINSISFPASYLIKDLYQQEPSITGIWKGKSLCTDQASGCHDEEVVYRVTQDAGSNIVKIDADRIANGKAVNMGELTFTYDKTKNMLTSKAGSNLWQLTVKGNQMTGVLLKDGVVFRNLVLGRE
jgi:hypothetical protein